jgi:hypothetical protein
MRARADLPQILQVADYMNMTRDIVYYYVNRYGAPVNPSDFACWIGGFKLRKAVTVLRNKKTKNQRRQAYIRARLASDPAYAYRYSERKSANQRTYHATRYYTDPQYRLARVLRARIRKVLKQQSAKKANLTYNLVGCPIPDVKKHLESQFKPGMTWENHGKVWQIDHILPCASFDLTDPAQQLKCFHWTNLQPLWNKDNQKKNAKLIYVPQNN